MKDKGITKQSLFCCLLEFKEAGIISEDEESELFNRIEESKLEDE